MTPTLIYCAKKNYFAPIAVACGFQYGAQLPHSVYAWPYFADQDYRRPRRAEYMAALELHRPALATVLDLESFDQLDEVLSWVDEAAGFVSEAIIIVPKCAGVIAELPRSVAGVPVRLGYAVPTTHGRTDVPEADFMGWPVHLLGGNPLEQFRLARPHLDEAGNFVSLSVVSVDCNYIQKSAVKWAQFLEVSPKSKQDSIYGARPALMWRQLHEVGLGDLPDAPYEAFRRSCLALVDSWASWV